MHCRDELNGLGPSLMGLTMGMSYLTSLNSQLLKDIAYVGSFKHFSVQLFLHVFCNSTKTSANSSVNDWTYGSDKIPLEIFAVV